MRRQIGTRSLFAFLIVFALIPTAARADDGLSLFVGLYLFGLAIYLIPTWIAFGRGHPNRWIIAVINIALGGTGIGWLGSLVWAFSAVHRSPTGNHGGESGLNLFVNDEKRVILSSPTFADPISLEKASGQMDDLSDRLLRLKRLREGDIISEEEYQLMRAPILDAVRNELR